MARYWVRAIVIAIIAVATGDVIQCQNLMTVGWCERYQMGYTLMVLTNYT